MKQCLKRIETDVVNTLERNNEFLDEFSTLLIEYIKHLSKVKKLILNTESKIIEIVYNLNLYKNRRRRIEKHLKNGIKISRNLILKIFSQ